MDKLLPEKIREHLNDVLSKHFSDDDLFIMGVSGGPDSMALLYLMYLLQRKVFVVHVNYGKRDESSDKDQELVEQMAFSWGFEICSISLDPSGAENQNFQNWARGQRYQFFRDFKENYNGAAIITAHHKDDQVETIFQKIMRGSAPTSWQGMDIWDGEILRPLLPFDKGQILNFCESEAVPYRVDASNEESDYARNFIRNELSVKMDSLFPGWQQNLLDLNTFGATYSSAIEEVLNSISDNRTIRLNELTELDSKLKTAVLKRFLDDHGLEGLYSKKQLYALSNIASVQTGKSIQIGEYKLTRDRNLLRLHIKNERDSIESQFITQDEADSGFEASYFTLRLSDQKPSAPNLRMDASKLKWPLIMRTWKHGDTIKPLGLQGTQKVSDHLTNRKIPTISREKALVLCGSGGTIYAIIYPDNTDIGERGAISDTVKCDNNTESYLTINF
ncbi:tRNA lysidine(34) synthetase TilS [Gracilimonas sp. Q87]|uniref:tRNA lysidine(34) synthetase TilS n=1 Tax=Gracilimonas sp. Q87 TaxID=3384766 RepID=UPI0039842010